MHKRTRRSPARFLAPLALIVVVVAFLAVVNGSGNGGSSTSDGATTPTVTTTSTTKKKAAVVKAKKKASSRSTYTVQVGDTLGSIASKTGVPLDQIESLNPNVDPHAMVTGQKIRLK